MPFLQLISNVPYIVLKQFADCDPALNMKNEEPAETVDWLHKNNSYQPHNADDENISTHLPGTFCVFHFVIRHVHV